MTETKTTHEIVEEVVRRIVDRFRPERIILFGSHARGDAGRDSDLDILVVMPVEGSRRRKATEIDTALIGLDVPVDIIVLTPEDVQKGQRRMGTVIGPAVREGRVLYERSA